ncbi:SprT family zinc-dependent metalloprotease [Pontixanthobacter gangjinensis]|nr:SprT family zinc-dependent metalloprotease [Pontixanthobacter gangjinensis]
MDWMGRQNETPTISVSGRDIPIAIRRHQTAKRLVMRLAPDGSEVRVTMPRWGQSRDAVDFARTRIEWLARQLSGISDKTPPAHGEKIPFRGDTLTIDWDSNYPRKPVTDDGNLLVGGPQSGLPARIEKWLRAEGLELMESDLTQYCERADVIAPKIALSKAQRRWGSCSSSGTVRINWRLIMAPDHVRRSVVAHEVAHLVHFDHSPAFYRLLGDLFEGELSAADSWLKRQGRSLYRYFG